MQVETKREQDIQVIVGLKAAYWRHTDDHAWDAVAACFTEDGTLDYPGKLCSGRRAIRDYLESTLGASQCSHNATRCEIEVGTDSATALWDANVAMTFPGGKKQTMRVTYDDAYVRDGHRWLISGSRMRIIPG